MKKFLNFGMFTALIVLITFGSVSCKKDDPEPEIVTNPLDETAYYVIGKVTEKNVALADVTVKTSGAETTSAQDGSFLLKVTQKGDLTVTFSKDDYITVTSDVTIPSNAASNSSVSVSQELTKKSIPETVSNTEETVITEPTEEKITFTFPAEAVSQPTDVSITKYTEGAKKISSGEVRLSLASFNCEPDGIVFEKPVKVALKNPVSNNIFFSNTKHNVEKNGKWEYVDDAVFNPAENVYSFELNSFSNHSISIVATQSESSTSTEALTTVVIDNLGVMTVKEQEISITQKYGWEIEGDLASILKTAIPELSDDDASNLVPMALTTIETLKGSKPGISETQLNCGTAKISGDMKYTVVFTSLIIKTNVAFSVTANNTQKEISVPVKTYSGVSSSATYERGNSYPDHSGGSGK
ncbi:MAG: TonB-dependent receptor [Massilibacteroides sp.]|nr:TonB-dependent receptor [Massilibacteroides sp.]MDD4115412.1 TonB-dependent receptor [Massilibacteroides sp.]MDD4660093.1 TonB-dependent receptor [Massilibacteroides sp.]